MYSKILMFCVYILPIVSEFLFSDNNSNYLNEWSNETANKSVIFTNDRIVFNKTFGLNTNTVYENESEDRELEVIRKSNNKIDRNSIELRQYSNASLTTPSTSTKSASKAEISVWGLIAIVIILLFSFFGIVGTYIVIRSDIIRKKSKSESESESENEDDLDSISESGVDYICDSESKDSIQYADEEMVSPFEVSKESLQEMNKKTKP